MLWSVPNIYLSSGLALLYLREQPQPPIEMTLHSGPFES